MKHRPFDLLPVLALALSGLLGVFPSAAAEPAEPAEPLALSAARLCRAAGIGGRNHEECVSAIIMDTEQLASAADESLHRARAAIRKGAFAEAETLLRAFIAPGPGAAAPGGKDLARAYSALGALHAPGREKAAIEFYEKARSLNPGDVSDAVHLAQIYERQNQPARAQALYRPIADAPDTDEPQAAYWRARALLGLGDIARKGGDATQAEAHYKAALALFTRIGRRYEQAQVNDALGFLALQRGQFDEARLRLSSALSYYREIGKKLAEADIRLNLGTVELRSGNFAAAEALYEPALKIYRDLDHKQGQFASHANLSTVLMQQGRLSEAESHNREALKLAAGLNNPSLEAAAMLNSGFLHDRRGDRAEACRHYAQAANKLAEALAPDADNFIKKIYLQRCARFERQANQLRPGRAVSDSEQAKALPAPVIVIGGDGGYRLQGLR